MIISTGTGRTSEETQHLFTLSHTEGLERDGYELNRVLKRKNING